MIEEEMEMTRSPKRTPTKGCEPISGILHKRTTELNPEEAIHWENYLSNLRTTPK